MGQKITKIPKKRGYLGMGMGIVPNQIGYYWVWVWVWVSHPYPYPIPNLFWVQMYDYNIQF